MSIVINSWCVNICALYFFSFFNFLKFIYFQHNSIIILYVLFISVLFYLKKNLKRKICIRQMIKKTDVNSINIRKHIDQKGKK